MNKSVKANTGSVSIPSVSVTTSTGIMTFAAAAIPPARGVHVDSKKLESAVYAHIQAVRALGRTQIEPQEIARALGLTVAQVQGTIQALKAKGVKTVHAP
jgi:hypothetical protein